MKILFVGEASYVHNTLKQGMQALGHDVKIMSDGNAWHNSPRDIDINRDMTKGVWGGLRVLWQLLTNIHHFVGNDVVQFSYYLAIPLKPFWNELFVKFVRRFNKCVVKGCFGDEPQVIWSQQQGVPEYSDMYVYGQTINVEEKAEGIRAHLLPECVKCWRNLSEAADILVPCTYDYYLIHSISDYKEKQCYQSLPIEIPEENMIKGQGSCLKVLVGIQRDRDYDKGAIIIADQLDIIARENPDKIVVNRVENVPYEEYCKMLDEADVLVDQLYSYDPSMNALAAMARGTVVIGGGEEEYYEFIGEKELRPIINVRPLREEYNLANMREALLTPGRISELSRQSIAFVKKHHDHLKVSQQYIDMYERQLNKRKQ